MGQEKEKERDEKNVSLQRILEIPRIKGTRVRSALVREESLFRGDIRENVTHLHQDAFKILAHRHAAQFHAEIADLEPRPFRLDLRLLLTGVDGRHFQHQQIEQTVRY